MAEFRSWQSYHTFAWTVKQHSRYIFGEEVKEFLETVIATSEGRKRRLPSDRIFWRAQLGHAWEKINQDSDDFGEVPGPYSSDRMKPSHDAAREGRANPKGIPVLYLATDEETAMAEVRPWIGSYISVGQFKTLKDLIVIDCSVGHARGSRFYFKEPDAPEREEVVWSCIDRSFSEPVTQDGSTADYAPTQVLSELFRDNGFDGVVYKSLLAKGHNIVLFDMDAADLINCFLFEVTSVKYEFRQAANPYFVTKYYERDKEPKA